MNNLILLFVVLVTGAQVYAQELLYKKIDWDKNPTWSVMDTTYNEKQEVVLIYEVIVECAYSEEYNNNLVEYFTIHKKIRVLGDDAIQGNNKVYIGMVGVAELIEAKARVVTPDGSVINFNEDKILESEGGDGLQAHKYFAIDGAVKGADIEYTYTILRGPNLDGRRFDLQGEYIRKNVDFTFASPSNLEFKFKSYNGLPEMKQDTTYEERNVFTLHVDSIGLLEEEDYSAFDKNLQHVIYKLHYNSFNRKSNITSFSAISQNLFEIYYGEIDKKDKKALESIFILCGSKKASSEEEKIKLFENYLKTHINIIPGLPWSSIPDIIDNGHTSSTGMIFMIIQGIRLMGIKHEFVLTSDRFENYFDEDFEHYAVLNNSLLYFPKLKIYMAPDEAAFRLGIVPSEWTDQKGLFVSEVTIGDVSTGLGKVKYITPLATEKTQDNMNISVSLENMDEPLIDFTREISGYSSVGFQAIYPMLDEDQKKELDEAFIKFADPNGEIVTYTVSGANPESVGAAPIVFKGQLKASSIIEKAGNKYLLKVGELIGPQAEMYQEKARKTDIVHDHNMVYNRSIKITIPEGYEVSGLEKLNMNEIYPLDNPSISFVSSFTQTGNSIEITVKEQYDDMLFDKAEIDEFRRIINAAANFNKIVVRLVKK